MKAILLLISFVAGCLFTAFFPWNSILFNSSKIVSLKQNVVIDLGESANFTILKGTRLETKTTFDDIGDYCLRFIITDPSVVEESNGDAMYFPKESSSKN